MTSATQDVAILNVTFDLPNLVVPANLGDRPWEFEFIETFGLTNKEIRSRYFDEYEDDLYSLFVEFEPRTENDGTRRPFKSHRLLVRIVQYPLSYTDWETMDVLRAVLERAVAEITMLLRQSIHRMPDPAVDSAFMSDYKGVTIARRRPSFFKPK